MEAGNLPHTEFKTLVKRICNKLTGRVDEIHENFNKEIEKLKNVVENIKKSVRNEEYITKMKNAWNKVNIRLNEAEDLISD